MKRKITDLISENLTDSYLESVKKMFQSITKSVKKVPQKIAGTIQFIKFNESSK